MYKFAAFLLLFTPSMLSGQIVSTVAGNGLMGNDGDGAPATNARISYPVGGAFDKNGNYYFCTSSTGNSVRKITWGGGTIHTVAGTGIPGFAGDNGPATAALLTPQAVAVDPEGNLYIADAGNNRVRKVAASTGIITTVVGTGVFGSDGDGGQAISAKISSPLDICFDKIDNLYIADNASARVRKVNLAGIISTVAGTGILFNSSGGGLADTTPIVGVSGVCTDDSGNLYVADWYSRVYKVNAAGFIHTIAGNGISGYTDGNGIALNASITPEKICIDKSGKLYVAEYDLHRIRTVFNTGEISTLTGNGVPAFSGDGGPVGLARVNYPSGVTLDTCGNLFFADCRNHRIRKIAFNPGCWPANVNGINGRDEMIRLYPNPVIETLQLHSAEEGEYQVLTIDGLELLTGRFWAGTNLINMLALPEGLYILKVTKENGEQLMHQIVKQ